MIIVYTSWQKKMVLTLLSLVSHATALSKFSPMVDNRCLMNYIRVIYKFIYFVFRILIT